MRSTDVYLGGLSLVARPARLTVDCDRCNRRIKATEQHYHCLRCNNYDLCLNCTNIGLYCQNDNHSWVIRLVIDGERFNIIGRITPEVARERSSMRMYPSKFQPPRATDIPESLFADEHRFIRNSDPREILIYTDGSCLGNGQSNPRGGCAFVYRPSAYTQTGSLTHGGTISFRLETKGPTGDPYKQTSNRAELRAVIAALQFRDWSMDCNRSWRSLVIATDSEYVAINATERIQHWEKVGWTLASQEGRRPAAVKNQDLWKLFLGVVRQLHGDGVNVSIWRIPRERNERADRFAKEGAGKGEQLDFHVVEPDGPLHLCFTPYQDDAEL